MENFAMSALERKKQGIAEHSMEQQYIFVTPSFLLSICLLNSRINASGRFAPFFLFDLFHRISSVKREALTAQK
jgi:hypothetical protein